MPVSFFRRSGRRAGLAALAAAASAVALTGAAAAPAASTPARVALPSPNLVGLPGTPTPLSPSQELTLRVYLSGQHPAQRVAAALAVSEPGNPAYTHFLTAAQYKQRYGATAAQAGTVTHWLTAQGMTVTAATTHYIAVQATVAQADAAFGTQVSDYVNTTTIGGHTFTYGTAGTAGGFSVPAALGADVATVTGIEETPVTDIAPGAQARRDPFAKGSAATAATGASAATAATGAPASGYRCSQYWGQYTEPIPVAYGHTSAPTQLCGYTPVQLRNAYGITSSPYTGKGTTIAIVLDGAAPTMLADANRYFASYGLAGFARGQFTENSDATLTSSCGSGFGDEPEEALDVESAHIAAPAAKIVYVAADCDPTTTWTMQDLLDADTRVVDQHLANVVTGSWGLLESLFSPADFAAWDLTFQQGALEGIGFDFSSGDGGADISEPYQPDAAVQFPATDPWVTAVGGTSLAIGRSGAAVADYAWGDNGTQIDAAGTGYTSPPPGDVLQGSGGGISATISEPGYQKPVVPTSLASDGGTAPARRVIPDIAANAGSLWWIGYTGAVTPGVYGQVNQGATSGSSPLLAGLEADAIQATGHPLGFLNAALYRLHGSAAIHDVGPVDPADPPMVIGAQSYFGDGTNYLTTLGEDQAPLRETTGYDDVTGLGAPASSFVTAFRRF